MKRPKLLTVRDLMDEFAISKTTVYDNVRRGVLPAPIHIGGSARWVPEEVDEARSAMVAAREAPPEVRRRGRPRKVVQ